MRACEIALFLVPLSLSFHIAMWRIMRQLQWSKEAEAKLGRVRVRRPPPFAAAGPFVCPSGRKKIAPGRAPKPGRRDGQLRRKNRARKSGSQNVIFGGTVLMFTEYKSSVGKQWRVPLICIECAYPSPKLFFFVQQRLVFHSGLGKPEQNCPIDRPALYVPSVCPATAMCVPSPGPFDATSIRGPSVRSSSPPFPPPPSFSFDSLPCSHFYPLSFC